jgi:hypothetical protein
VKTGCIIRDNIKTNLKRVGHEDADRIHVAQNRGQWKTVINFRIHKMCRISLSADRPLASRKVSAPWSLLVKKPVTKGCTESDLCDYQNYTLAH